jgi:GH24 family phage-related lysozyme (muramidase)
VNSTITAKLSQNQFDALVLTFNIGAANLARSSVAKMVNDPPRRPCIRR